MGDISPNVQREEHHSGRHVWWKVLGRFVVVVSQVLQAFLSIHNLIGFPGMGSLLHMFSALSDASVHDAEDLLLRLLLVASAASSTLLSGGVFLLRSVSQLEDNSQTPNIINVHVLCQVCKAPSRYVKRYRGYGCR